MLTDELKEILEQAIVPPDLTEYLKQNERGDAELFAVLYADKVVYDHAQKVWYLWRGSYWEEDRRREVIDMMNSVAAEYLDRASEERARGNIEKSNHFIERARLLQTRRRIENVLYIAASLPVFALSGEEWDAHSMLLPVKNGVIDLATGDFRPSQPRDYIRAYCPVEWLGLDTPAPLWEQTLQEIFDNNADVLAFIQRLLGYSISTSTKEQVLPIFWGDGANGKSTIMDTLSAVMGGDICFSTQADSLMDIRQGDGDGARPFVVALRGKRLVWASESREGQRLNAGLIKQLTGDGYITARGLHTNPVTFKQTHKIIMLTNHCPRIADSDDFAMWRRVLRVPFNVRFVENPKLPHERKLDKDLPKKLLAEAPGILAWLVRGCLTWQREGLNPPAAVIESTEKYREDEDLTGQFIEERLIVGETLTAATGDLYRVYSQWCEEYGYNPMSARAFGQRMTKRFGETVRERKGGRQQRVYTGVGILE